MPQVEVTFDIDANGILNVSAKDHATNKEQKITITASTGLSKEEAEKMRSDAEAHAEDDKKKLAEIEARNILDNRVYQVEKLIADNRDKAFRIRYQAGGRGCCGGEVRARRRHPRADPVGDVATRDALRTSSPRCSTRPRRPAERRRATAGSADARPGAPKSGAGPGSEGEVIDAEYVDVDETKKPN